MRCSRACECEASRPWLPRGLTLLLALALSACAQSQSYHHQSNVGADAPTHRVAVASPPRVKIERDGLPEQHPPRRHSNPAVDDPSEPFSPNYGPPPRSNGLSEEPPAAQPANTVHRAAFDKRKAQAIIARAVAMHELRSQAAGGRRF